MSIQVILILKMHNIKLSSSYQFISSSSYIISLFFFFLFINYKSLTSTFYISHLPTLLINYIIYFHHSQRGPNASLVGHRQDLHTCVCYIKGFKMPRWVMAHNRLGTTALDHSPCPTIYQYLAKVTCNQTIFKTAVKQ